MFFTQAHSNQMQKQEHYSSWTHFDIPTVIITSTNLILPIGNWLSAVHRETVSLYFPEDFTCHKATPGIFILTKLTLSAMRCLLYNKIMARILLTTKSKTYFGAQFLGFYIQKWNYVKVNIFMWKIPETCPRDEIVVKHDC